MKMGFRLLTWSSWVRENSILEAFDSGSGVYPTFSIFEFTRSSNERRNIFTGRSIMVCWWSICSKLCVSILRDVVRGGRFYSENSIAVTWLLCTVAAIPICYRVSVQGLLFRLREFIACRLCKHVQSNGCGTFKFTFMTTT